MSHAGHDPASSSQPSNNPRLPAKDKEDYYGRIAIRDSNKCAGTSLPYCYYYYYYYYFYNLIVAADVCAIAASSEWRFSRYTHTHTHHRTRTTAHDTRTTAHVGRVLMLLLWVDERVRRRRWTRLSAVPRTR